MKTASRIVVVSFFVTVSLLVLYSLLTQAPKSPRVLAAEDAATIRNLRFFTTFWQIACAATAAVLLVTVLPVGLSYSRSLLKKASVHLYKVGSSEIVVHERDLSLAWPGLWPPAW